MILGAAALQHGYVGGACREVGGVDAEAGEQAVDGAEHQQQMMDYLNQAGYLAGEAYVTIIANQYVIMIILIILIITGRSIQRLMSGHGAGYHGDHGD